MLEILLSLGNLAITFTRTLADLDREGELFSALVQRLYISPCRADPDSESVWEGAICPKLKHQNLILSRNNLDKGAFLEIQMCVIFGVRSLSSRFTLVDTLKDSVWATSHPTAARYPSVYSNYSILCSFFTAGKSPKSAS
jgi:hypothetical protein